MSLDRLTSRKELIMKQETLFDTKLTRAGGVIPYNPPVKPIEAKARLSRQCHTILTRLKAGPAYNGELAKISRKYTGRISDIRKEGIRIEATPVDRKTGVWKYELVER